MRKLLMPRIGALLSLVIVLAAGLNAFLTRAKFEDTYATVEESRLGFALEAVRNSLQGGLDMGMPLDALPDVPRLLAAEIAASDGVSAMSVRDDNGTELYRAGAAAADSSADTASLEIPLTDNLGRTVGAVSLRFATDGRAAFRERINGAAWSVTLVAAVVGSLAVFVLGRSFLGDARRKLNAEAAEVVRGGCPGGEGSTAAALAAFDAVERGLSDPRSGSAERPET